eukprot:TRINITY_DN14850_c0_g2_i3.p1 TRINITY_DN14850_c0_g2~~TRINITY_DN14850_c0_g2_i3.p1  ORF type:complete len:142 (-),score=28.94 TRINITY_DN14850_c0_g2_i3:93-518(-)
MRNEACENCNVPLMKNKSEEMYCVSCYNYYTLNGTELVFSRSGALLKELGGNEAKSVSPTKVGIQTPYSEDKQKGSASISDKKIHLIESMIIPALESQLSGLCKLRPENVGVGKVEAYVKEIRLLYEEISKFTHELSILKK